VGEKKKKQSVRDTIEAVQDQTTSSAMDIDADADGPRDVKAKSKAADKGKALAVGLGLGEKRGEVNFTIDWKPKDTVKDKGKEQQKHKQGTTEHRVKRSNQNVDESGNLLNLENATRSVMPPLFTHSCSPY
jgi:hypothetical protein